MPVPSCVRAGAPSIRWKRSKMCGSCSSAIPVPVSVTDSSTVVPASRSVTVMVPVKRELEGVGEQIQDNLLVEVAVDIDRLGEWRTVDEEAHPGPFDSGAEHAGEFGGE